MLYYNRIDISEEIDTNKTIASKECDICNYQYLLNKKFKLNHTYVIDAMILLIMSMNLTHILNIKMSIIVVLLMKLVKVKL